MTPSEGEHGTVTVILPYPISSNRYWRSYVPRGHTRAIVVLSDEAKAYKSAVQRIAISAGINEPIKGRVSLSVELYPSRPADWAKRARKDPAKWDDTVQCLDLDNALKVTIDALKNTVIDDDRWVRRIDAQRMAPDEYPARLIVTVRVISVTRY